MLKNHADSEKEFYSFSDLVDVAAFSRLLEKFFRATGIPNGLVGPDGELISQAGWCDACSQFHRVNPEAKRQCEESNLELMQKLQEGEIAGNLCKNGLYDYATPIVVDGHQLATLFLGQVFNAPPDIKLFHRQAKRFGFDQDEYLDAIRAVPVVSKKQMEAHMQTMVEVTQILAANGLARMQETRLKLDLDKSTEQRIQIQDLLDLSPVGIGWSDADGNIDYINHKFTELFGYTMDDLPDIETWYRKAYPDAGYRKATVEPWQQRVIKAKQLDVAPPELEAEVTCKDGSKRHVLIRVSWVGDKRLVNFTDITAHWQSEQRDRAHNAMLEMVAKAEPLPNILNALVVAIEAEAPWTLCSVHILDEKRKHLVTVSAPSLPAFYNDATDKVEIGDGVGSCGTAVFRRARVIVEDISTHEYWRDLSDLAQQAGLASCWSEPIISSDDRVLGTFAIYHRQPAVPNLEEIERIAFGANLAAIAIESHNTREELLKKEREFRTLAENAPVNIARYDLEGNLIYANPELISTIMMPMEQHLDKKPEDQPKLLPFTARFLDAVDHTLNSGMESSFEIKIPNKDGHEETHYFTMVTELDESGVITGVLCTGLDITERKQLEEQLAERECEFRTLAENIPINISRFDRDGHLTYANSRLAADFTMTIEKLFGTQLSEEPSQPYTEIVMNSVMRTLEDGVERSFEIEIPINSSTFVTHLITMVAERDESGSIIGVLATGKDVSERKRLQRELERQARLDFLTGLLNRRYFIELSKMELLRLKRNSGKLSLIMFDIDHFKQINDKYGHSTGDLVLKRIAHISHETVREIDIVGRLGGEEFVVLLPQTDKQQAFIIAERLRLAIADQELKSDEGKDVHFTASFGVVTINSDVIKHDDSIKIDDILIMADKAMYQAKANGRNNVYQDI